MSSVDLPEACQTRTDTEPSLLPITVESLDIPIRQWPRTDKAHIALENVPELGQFVQAQLSENRPTRVILGSFFILNAAPLTSLSSSSSSCRCSASVCIVLNLIIRNRRRLKPTLSWTKNTGPRESILIANEMKRNTGEAHNQRHNRCRQIDHSLHNCAAREEGTGPEA